MKTIATALSLLTALVLASTADNRPSFVVLMTDDQGYGDLDCYGSDRVKTPHIDQLAADGIRFTQFYAPAPSCSPTRCGVLTGRVPLRLGIYTYIPLNSAIHLKRSERTG